jgi:hypothetical protein
MYGSTVAIALLIIINTFDEPDGPQDACNYE